MQGKMVDATLYHKQGVDLSLTIDLVKRHWSKSWPCYFLAPKLLFIGATQSHLEDSPAVGVVVKTLSTLSHNFFIYKTRE